MAPPLDLQDFLLRARVLKLYRHALRIARRAPTDTRGHSFSSNHIRSSLVTVPALCLCSIEQKHRCTQPFIYYGVLVLVTRETYKGLQRVKLV